MITLKSSLQLALSQQGVVLPSELLSTHYNGSLIPGAKDQDRLSLGANCQVFAYSLLKANNRTVKNHRSRELWQDESYLTIQEHFVPLDLMLYNDTGEAYGAHVAVYLVEGMLIHLSKEKGEPEIVSHHQIQLNPKYRQFIGAKRVA